MASLQNVNQLVDFFVYSKEVNALVANQRSLASDKLVCLVTANDLSGVKLIGGDATFRTALSSASKISSKLYPTLNGPTLLLNLPALLGALAKLFTPLFPPEVRKRLKFEQGPLAKVNDLMDVSYGGNGRAAFLDEIDKIVYKAN
jgi:CRAL/TRIO domain